MKHKIQHILASLLAITLLACSASATTFPDVDENAEYAEPAEYLNQMGIMVGDNQGNFNPNKTVTRFANTGDLLNRWQIAQLVYNFSI